MTALLGIIIRSLDKAAWQDDKNIGDENVSMLLTNITSILITKVLREVLFLGGFRGDYLMEAASTVTVKEQLKVNTKRCDNHDQ